MVEHNKIRPFVAMLICLNSIIGAGLFINPKPLAMIAGPFGFVGYILAACILMPIIYCTAELARLHPVSGGIYVFARSYLGPVFGFISCWSYFVGKTSSAALLSHKFMQFMQSIVPALANVPILVCDFLLIFSIIALNVGGMSIGGGAQYFFTVMRIIPLLGAFGIGFSLFSAANFDTVMFNFSSIFSTLPIVVYAFLGFEMICAVGHLIQDSQKNIKRVILSSFVIVAVVSVMFQIALYGVLGSTLQYSNSPLGSLFQAAYPDHSWLSGIFGAMVFVAILGTCFAMLTSNCWNLFTLASDGHLPGKSFLTYITANHVPLGSLIVEGCLSCIFLMITTDQISLQNMTVFAQVISYFFTTTATLAAICWFKATPISPWFARCGIISSLFILSLALTKIINSGVSFSFASIFLVGIGSMFFMRYRRK